MRGSKVRAPASGKNKLCQHIVNRKHGSIEIIMECEMCRESGLQHSDCYKGALKALQLEGAASTIILRSHIERRYDTESTRVMNQLAEILNRSDELRSQLAVDSKRSDKCSGCLGPLMMKLDNLKSSMLSRRITASVRQINMLSAHNFRQGQNCEECSRMIGLQLTSMSNLASNLEKDILAGTFNIVGGSE